MIPLPFNSPPQQVCLLRLSAIGDACHVVAALRALQSAWPRTHFSWIIGKVEARLMAAILPEVEFISFDKNATVAELFRLRRVLGNRRFDLLLDLQLSLRASAVSTLVRSPVKLGFDRARAREGQWLFTNAQVPAAAREHVLDSFLGFVRTCGVEPGTPRFDVTLPADARAYASQLLPDTQPTLLISPCSSHPLRNWSAERYAALADHAHTRHGMRIILVGGRSALERRMGEEIERTARVPLINQIGRDTLPQLLGLMAASAALLSPDSGPAHMATMVGLPVLGLYAATRTARAGPYFSRQWCVDRYATAAQRYCGKSAEQIAWTTKIEKPGVMDLIEVSDVIDRLDALRAAGR